MRWFVDVSSVGKAAEKQRYCVEADSWQRALQAARVQRSDPGPMTGFSIELLDDGFSAVDPVKRMRYSIRKAPADEPLTEAGKPSTPPPSMKAAAKTSQPPPPASVRPDGADHTTGKPPSTRSSRPPAPDLKLSPKGKGKTPAPSQVQVVETPAPAPVAPAAPAHTPLEIIAKREQDPGPGGPLTYREYAFFIETPPSKPAAEQLLRRELEGIQATISGARAGKLVNLALFTVRFTGRPPVLPLATLTWKDWKGNALVSFPVPRAVNVVVAEAEAPRPAAPAVPVAPISTATVRMSIDEVPMPEGPVPPLASSLLQRAPEPPTPAVSPAVPPPPLEALPSVVIAETPAPPQPGFPAVTSKGFAAIGHDGVALPSEAPPDSSAPPTTRAPASMRPVVVKRLRGDELIADLFESMHDSQFLRDSIEGAEFCLTLALEKMPAHGGIVHLYDINRREFVITCVGGTGGESLLTQRSSENDPILAPTMRKRRPLVLADATADETARSTKRYAALGGAKSLMVAPVAVGGRFLGAIELLNPVDSVPFTDDDGHALAYIAEQLAAFVSQRGILLEREKSVPPPPAKSGRSATVR